MKKLAMTSLSIIMFSVIGADAQKPALEKATFGMGCFWCTEAVFQRLNGVSNVRSGYEGGDTVNPTYEEICTGTTNHAEVIELNYDPNKISFEELLEVFWKIHDPTTLNRQGADVGTQYRSVIFYHNEKQREIANKQKELLNKENVFGKPVVTQIEKAQTFYIAENYHQDYYLKNGQAPYCKAVILPKMDKLEKLFKSKLKQ
jgi:peptide-methionine (S)-S-oxide reductase